MESKLFKRLSSLALVLFMVISMLPTPVFAAEQQLEATDTNGCPHCEGTFTWTELGSTSNLTVLATTGHYKLTEDVTLPSEITIASGNNVVIDLAGHTMTAYKGNRAFTVSLDSALYIIDSSAANTGKLQGSGTATASGKHGGVVYVTGGRFELHDATVTGGKVAGAVRGGNIYGTRDKDSQGNYRNGVIVINNGKVTNGSYDSNNVCRGGNVCIYYADLYMYGEDAEISGGTIKTATTQNANGGNVYVGNAGTLYMYGGTIAGATVTAKKTLGLNICGLGNEDYNANIYVYGGTIGSATDSTGDCYVYGSGTSICNFYMFGGTVYGMYDGGNLNTIKLYNGVVGADPTTINSDGSSALADCACAVANDDGTYTIWNYKHGTCTTDCPYEAVLSADEEDDNYAITQQEGEHVVPDGATQCTVCNTEVTLQRMWRSLMRIFRSAN